MHTKRPRGVFAPFEPAIQHHVHRKRLFPFGHNAESAHHQALAYIFKKGPLKPLGVIYLTMGFQETAAIRAFLERFKKEFNRRVCGRFEGFCLI